MEKEYKENEILKKATLSLDYSDRFELEDNEGRRIYINAEIDESIIDTTVYHILRYNRLDKDIPINERKPIKIYISTPGGIVTAGYALIDAIITSKTPVYTINLGTAYSMGFLIFIAGTKRYSMPSATYLLHDGSSFAWDSTNKLKDRVEFEAGEMEEHTKKYIVDRTNISEEKYVENMRKEWYFYPEEAKKLGVVTHIVGTDCDIDEII